MKLDCVDCADRIFEGYDMTNPPAFAERALPGGRGFPLATTAPCLFTSRPGGASGTDVLGTPRAGVASTVGAHELPSSVDCTR